jgi:hypothetical protein
LDARGYLSRLTEVADIVAQGAAFTGHGGTPNLHDRWEDDQRDVHGGGGRPPMSAPDRLAKARALAEYAVGAEEVFRGIDREHGAAPGARPAPAGSPPARPETEDEILTRVLDTVAAAHETRLLEIDRGWEGVQDPGTHEVWIQRWRNPNSDADRRGLWDTFQILIHEYCHVLEHPDYRAYVAAHFPPSSPENNTLFEGVCSLLTEVVWRRVEAHLSDPALVSDVEGPTHAGQPFNPRLVPDISNRRYGSYVQAAALVDVVGIRNLYGAFLAGQVDLIRSRP